jgi:predicted O-methyltransferase YrrM
MNAIDKLKTVASRNRLLRRLGRIALAVVALFRRPPFVPPGHFYSPLTGPADAERALSWVEARSAEDLPGVDLQADAQLELAGAIAPMLAEPFEGPRYSRDNEMFPPADAAVYRALLRRLRPKRLIEIGSGYSTALALDTADAHLDGLDLTCVEPYPEALLALLEEGDSDRVTLLSKPVQEVPLDTYAALGAGDLLFIDSTHVAKAGSDVLWLYFEVLPRLAPGVILHVHDVFWPFEYPREWLLEGRDWTENYLLHAFLINNARWEVLLFSSWLWKEHPSVLPAALRSGVPGSIWLESRSS